MMRALMTLSFVAATVGAWCLPSAYAGYSSRSPLRIQMNSSSAFAYGSYRLTRHDGTTSNFLRCTHEVRAGQEPRMYCNANGDADAIVSDEEMPLGVQVVCHSSDPELVASARAIPSYAYVAFRAGDLECEDTESGRPICEGQCTSLMVMHGSSELP